MAGILKSLFSRHLLMTNTLTSGTLLALGDVITQRLEIEYRAQVGDTTLPDTWDVYRTGDILGLLQQISRLKCYYAFFLVCCGCDTSYIVSVHIQIQAFIYTLSLCRGHSWRVRLAKQETLTPPGLLVSPLVCRGP